MTAGTATDRRVDPSPFSLLTKLFVRRLVDNDALSTTTDRHESLAVMYALAASLSVFATFFMCVGYLSAFVEPPAVAAVSAISDRFLFIAAAIAVSAIGALIVWDALALEARDAAVLGPLPVPLRTITRAKLAAAVAFGAALAVTFNTAPSVIHPLFLTLNIRVIPGAVVLRLMAAHALTVTMGALFGFFSVLAVRGLTRLALGERLFQRVSSTLQGVLIVMMVTALLAAPTVRNRDVRQWTSGTATTPLPATPVLWYLGLNETIAGRLVAEQPFQLPPRLGRASDRLIAMDSAARSAYLALIPRFSALSQPAWIALAGVFVLAIVTFFQTNRRLPDRSAIQGWRPAVRRRLAAVGARYLRDDPETQAGFFFALQTLTRSAPHRAILAVALAVGLTHALVASAGAGWRSFDAGSAPLGVLAIAPGLVTALLAGISRAIVVPATPSASWIIRTAWLGDSRPYLAGVKRAAVLVAAIAVALSFPIAATVIGTAAIPHALACGVYAFALTDLVLWPCRAFPFASDYVPIENPRAAWPRALGGTLLLTYGFAAAERWAFRSPAHLTLFALAIVAGAVALHSLDTRRRAGMPPLEFDTGPIGATLRLNLAAHR